LTPAAVGLTADGMSEASKIAAAWWVANVDVTDKKTPVALEALRAKLESVIDEHVAADGECRVECDWNPDWALREVCQALLAEHGSFHFPIKTKMLIERDYVTVRANNTYEKLFGVSRWKVDAYDAETNHTPLANLVSEESARYTYKNAKRDAASLPGFDVYLICDGNILEGD
jgi:hypothetical protein